MEKHGRAEPAFQVDNNVCSSMALQKGNLKKTSSDL